MTLRAVKLCYLQSIISCQSVQFSFTRKLHRFHPKCKRHYFINTMGTHVKLYSSDSVSSNRSGYRSKPSSHFRVEEKEPIDLAKTIFFQGLQNVLPAKLISSQVQLQGSLLRLNDEENTIVDLSQYNKKYVIGFGKACLPMAESLVALLNGLVDRCIVSVPTGTRSCRNNAIEVCSGAKDNIPDEDSFAASKKIVELVLSCHPNDLLLVLISGGGSALLPYPIPPITLEEKQHLIKSLSRAGCTINEMNTVRKRLSMVKGGGLVRMCQAGKIISLIISDVTDSPLDIIASGPTVPNLDQADAALSIIKKFDLAKKLAPSIREVLGRNYTVPNDSMFEKVTNFIIGDNEIALVAAAQEATKCGLRPFIISSRMSGEAANVGYDLATLTEAFARILNRDSMDAPPKNNIETIVRIFKHHRWSVEGIISELLEEQGKSSKGVCFLFGGETTVTVRGNGMGGRNQEMALSAGIRLDISRNLPHLKSKVAILCAGTDGFDGPNNAAGAVIEGPTIHNAQIQGFSPLEYLRENDSFNFFNSVSCGKYHIVCGHTETNVMDIAIIVILKKERRHSQESNVKSNL